MPDYVSKKLEIAALYKEGKSSIKIAKILSQKYNEDYDDRLIRKTIKRLGIDEVRKTGTISGKKSARVLVFDIETAPILAFTWSLYPNSIGTDMVKKDWFMFSWSGKWLFEDKILSHVLTPKEAKAGNDKRIVKALWDALNEADVVISHNGVRFDVKKSNARFLEYGLNLPSPYQVIDTLLHARKKFGLTSNRLDYIAKNVLGIDGKSETPKGLWWKCYDGDKESLETMRSYCDQDVRVLEDVYFALRPYIQPHPNIGLLEGGNTNLCPSCGSDDLTPTGTPYRTYVNEFESLRCDDCGSLSRRRVNNTPLPVKQRMLVSLPK